MVHYVLTMVLLLQKKKDYRRLERALKSASVVNHGAARLMDDNRTEW